MLFFDRLILKVQKFTLSIYFFLRIPFSHTKCLTVSNSYGLVYLTMVIRWLCTSISRQIKDVKMFRLLSFQVILFSLLFMLILFRFGCFDMSMLISSPGVHHFLFPSYYLTNFLSLIIFSSRMYTRVLNSEVVTFWRYEIVNNIIPRVVI